MAGRGNPSPEPRPASPILVDVDAWRRFLLVKRNMRPVTVDYTVTRLSWSVRHGFDVHAFVHADAQLAGEKWLEKRLLEGATVHAYNNDVKWLNNLAAFLRYRDVRFHARREPPRRPKALTPEQKRALLAYAHPMCSVRLLRRALVWLELHTGLRASEMRRLELLDLDARGSRLHVRYPAKGGMVRWIPVPRWLWSSRRPLGAYLRARPRPIANSQAVWTIDRWGPRRVSPRPIGAAYLNRTLFLMGRELGFPLNFTILRHTFATECARRGLDTLYIQFLLGHASITSTQIYVEIGEEDVARVYRERPPKDPYGGRRA